MSFKQLINIMFFNSPDNKNEFADRLGISRFTLRNYLLGKTCPSYDEAIRIIMAWELGKKEPEDVDLPV